MSKSQVQDKQAEGIHPPLTSLGEEELLFQSSLLDFARNEIGPHVAEMDATGIFKPELLERLFAQGIMGIEIPEAYGGSGGTFFMSILAIEALARVDPSASVIADVQNTLITNALLRWGSDEQKQKYLPPLARDTVGAYALSEAGSGSDAFALRTRATEQGDAYLLDGRKLWITNASEAELFIIFATINPELGYKGITAFLVDKDRPGFTIGSKEDKLGIRASSTCELLLDQCRLPKSAVLGNVGEGYKIAIETLNEGRIGIGAQMLGLAQGALDHTVRYVKEREQFGRAIGSFQGVQFQLAEMATEVEAGRLLVYNAARLKNAGQPFLTKAAMAKLYASEMAQRVASLCIDLHGGYGFTKEYPVEKLYRDAKIGTIYEGTSNMQRQTIAKALMR